MTGTLGSGQEDNARRQAAWNLAGRGRTGPYTPLRQKPLPEHKVRGSHPGRLAKAPGKALANQGTPLATGSSKRRTA